MHERKAFRWEFTVVGREKGLYSEEKEKDDEEDESKWKQSLHTDESEGEIKVWSRWIRRIVRWLKVNTTR